MAYAESKILFFPLNNSLRSQSFNIIAHSSIDSIPFNRCKIFHRLVIASLLSILILTDIKGVSNFNEILNNVSINFLVKLNVIQPGAVFRLLHVALPRASVRFKQHWGASDYATYFVVVVTAPLNLTQSQALARYSRDAHELSASVALVLPLSLVP